MSSLTSKTQPNAIVGDTFFDGISLWKIVVSLLPASGIYVWDRISVETRTSALETQSAANQAAIDSLTPRVDSLEVEVDLPDLTLWLENQLL